MLSMFREGCKAPVLIYKVGKQMELASFVKTTSYLISTDGVSSTIITRELRLPDGLVKKKNFF